MSVLLYCFRDDSTPTRISSIHIQVGRATHYLGNGKHDMCAGLYADQADHNLGWGAATLDGEPVSRDRSIYVRAQASTRITTHSWLLMSHIHMIDNYCKPQPHTYAAIPGRLQGLPAPPSPHHPTPGKWLLHQTLLKRSWLRACICGSSMYTCALCYQALSPQYEIAPPSTGGLHTTPSHTCTRSPVLVSQGSRVVVVQPVGPAAYPVQPAAEPAQTTASHPSPPDADPTGLGGWSRIRPGGSYKGML